MKHIVKRPVHLVTDGPAKTAPFNNLDFLLGHYTTSFVASAMVAALPKMGYNCSLAA